MMYELCAELDQIIVKRDRLITETNNPSLTIPKQMNRIILHTIS